jgi:hypothetical protein
LAKPAFAPTPATAAATPLPPRKPVVRTPKPRLSGNNAVALNEADWAEF